MGSNKRYLIVIILAVIAITIAAIGSVKGAVATEPVRPWYLEPPEVFQPTHIREGDRLYASYFNEQFNVIYNWAQLLNREWKNFTNGTGIASITANLITAKDKIVTPVISIIKGNQPAPDGNGGLIYYDKDLDRFRAYQEGAWRDLSSNVYIASDTIGSPLTIQGYLQASNIYASNTVYAHGVNNTGTLTNTGNVTIVGNTVASGTLTVNKALTTKAGINNTGTLTNTGNVTIVGNTVASGTLTVNEALTTKAGINNTGNVVTEGLNATKRLKVPTYSSTQTADSSLGKGSLYYDSTNNKLKAYNGSTWVDVASGTGEWTTSSTTGNKTINGNLNLTGVLQKGSNVVIDENGMILANKGLQIPTAPGAGTPMIGQFYIRQSDNMLRYFDGSNWQNVGGSTQTVDTAMSDTSTNAVQNKVIKTYADTKLTEANNYTDKKTAGISSETANINHANIIDLNGGDIGATNVEVTTKLKIPTSKTSYPTTGSIYFNAASDTLNVYDNGSWISFGSNVTISTAPVTVYFGDAHGHETTVTINTKIIEIGEHIVIWQLYGTPQFSNGYEINSVQISMPDQISGCETLISSEGQVDYNISGGHGLDKITTMAHYDAPQYYDIVVVKGSIKIYVSSNMQPPLSFVDNFTVPDMFVVGFK